MEVKRKVISTNTPTASSTGAILGAASTPGKSVSNPEVINGVNSAGQKSAQTSAKVELLHQGGYINSETKEEAMFQLGLAEMAAFNQARGAGSNSGTGEPSESSSTPKSNTAPTSTTTPPTSFNSVEPTPRVENPSIELADMHRVEEEAVESSSGFAQQIAVPVVRAIATDGTIDEAYVSSEANTDESAKITETASPKVKMDSSGHGTTNPSTAQRAIEGRLDASGRTLLAHLKRMRSLASEEKKPVSGKSAGQRADGEVSAEAQGEATTVLTFSNGKKLFTDALIPSDLDPGRDVGCWILGCRSDTPKVGQTAVQMKLAEEKASKLGNTILLVVTALLGAGMFFYQRSARYRPQSFLLDQKTKDYKIRLIRMENRKVALLDTVNRANGRVTSTKELMPESVLTSRSVPPILAAKLGVEIEVGRVRYLGGWTFEKTTQPLGIAVRAASKRSS